MAGTSALPRGTGRPWERLVDQYAKLIWAMTRDFKLAESDAADVAQATWLRLLEHIDRLEYPARVGSWLATTARHECLRSLAARKKIVLAMMTPRFEGVAAHEPESTSACSPRNAPRRFARPSPACPGAGSGCLSC